jgi:hypothetical protein
MGHQFSQEDLQSFYSSNSPQTPDDTAPAPGAPVRGISQGPYRFSPDELQGMSKMSKVGGLATAGRTAGDTLSHAALTAMEMVAEPILAGGAALARVSNPGINADAVTDDFFSSMDSMIENSHDYYRQKDNEVFSKTGAAAGHIAAGLAMAANPALGVAMGGAGTFDTAKDMLQKGYSLEQVAAMGIPKYMIDQASMAIPFGAGAGMAARAGAGAVGSKVAAAVAAPIIGEPINAASRAVENLTAPDEYKQDVLPTSEELLTSSATEALFGIHGAAGMRQRTIEGLHREASSEDRTREIAANSGLSVADQLRKASGLAPTGAAPAAPTAAPGGAEEPARAALPPDKQARLDELEQRAAGGGTTIITGPDGEPMPVQVPAAKLTTRERSELRQLRQEAQDAAAPKEGDPDYDLPPGQRGVTRLPARRAEEPQGINIGDYEGPAAAQEGGEKPEPVIATPGTGINIHDYGGERAAAPTPERAPLSEHIEGAPPPTEAQLGYPPEERVSALPPPKSDRQLELERLHDLTDDPVIKKDIAGKIDVEAKKTLADIAAHGRINAARRQAAEFRRMAAEATDPDLRADWMAKAEKLDPAQPEAQFPLTEKPKTAPAAEPAAAPGDASAPAEPETPSSVPAPGAAPIKNGYTPAERAEELRQMATHEAGWAERGGRIIRENGKEGEVTGRTPWVPASDWFGAMRKAMPKGASLAHEKDIQAAVEKAIKGEKLSAAQQRTVDFMLEEIRRRDAEDHAALLQKHGHGSEHLDDHAALLRANEIDEAAVERLAVKHQDDPENTAFMKDIREFLDAHPTADDASHAGDEPGHGEANEESAVRRDAEKEPVVEPGRDAVRDKQSAGAAEPERGAEERPEVQPAGTERGTAAGAEVGKPVEPSRPKFDLRGLSVNDAEKELRGLARPEQKGDVMLSNGDTVPLADAVRLAREAIDTGQLKPNPAQMHFGLGLAMRDAARVLDAVREAQGKPEFSLSNPTPESLAARENIAKEAEAGQQPLLGADELEKPPENFMHGFQTKDELNRRWGEGQQEAARRVAEYRERVSKTMAAHVNVLRKFLDSQGLNWAHKDTEFGADRNIKGDALCAFKDGKYRISIKPDLLMSGDDEAIVHALLHEIGHVIDKSGFLYSQDSAFNGAVMKDGRFVPTGDIAKELYNLWRGTSDSRLKALLSYPFDKQFTVDADGKTMERNAMGAEMFAQAFYMHNNPYWRGVLAREAPKTAKFLEDVHNHAEANGETPTNDNFFDSAARLKADFDGARSSGSFQRAGAGGHAANVRGSGDRGSEAGRASLSIERSLGEGAAGGAELPELAKKEPFFARLMQHPAIEKMREIAAPIARDFQVKVVPMADGDPRYQAMAKEAANSMRLAQAHYARWFDVLERNYKPEELRRMWEAGDEENDLRRDGKTDPTKGLASLPADQRETMDFMSAKGTELLAQARAEGMYEGEGVDYWVPRTAARIGEDGKIAPLDSSGKGGGFSTKSPNLTGRTAKTTAESEQRLQAKFGTEAEYVKDIRTMPLAMARLERAIAARKLVNEVLNASSDLAMNRDDFVTIDHPAFKSYRVEMKDGEPVWTVKNMTIPKDAEGPLKAVIQQPSGEVYKAIMAVKNWSSQNIMWSPFIHLGVELGRAFPVMPGKMLTMGFWKDGHAMKDNPELMDKFIKAGLVPIGRQNLKEDISMAARDPELDAGRGLTAKAAGWAAGKVGGDEASLAARKAVDKAGDFLHGTLLWDRVADLQNGIALSTHKWLTEKRGMEDGAAAWVAAHIANRYAGALPNEAMSGIARKLANVLQFSRSFTIGNLGAMKDVITGLPRDVQASILRDYGQDQLDKAVSAGKRKARMGLVADMALMYGLNAAVQMGISALRSDKDLLDAIGDEGAKAIDHMSQALERTVNDPMAALMHPIDTIGSFSPTANNEPGREDRVFYGKQEDGTAIYLRLPFGKVAEEVKGWATRPVWHGDNDQPSMVQQKLSTLAGPLVQAFTNDKGLHQKVYNPSDSPLVKVGKSVENFMSEQVPTDSLKALWHIAYGQATGEPTWGQMDALKVVGPALGFTFSKGRPGGPDVGLAVDTRDEHAQAISERAPELKQAIHDHDDVEAQRIMNELRMTKDERHTFYKLATNPGMTRSTMKKFLATASPDQLEKMREIRNQQ